MESVGDVLKGHPSRFQYQDLVQQIVKDPDVAAFIQKESLSQEEEGGRLTNRFLRNQLKKSIFLFLTSD